MTNIDRILKSRDITLLTKAYLVKAKVFPVFMSLVLLPGEAHGRRSLVGYSPWGHKESDTDERLN